MHVSFGTHDDVFHNLRKNGSYEWWYFDGVSTDLDYSFVIIFFVGIPMSATYISSYEKTHKQVDPIENCGISVNIYYQNKRIYTTLQEGLGKEEDFSTTNCQGVFGNNQFSFDKKTNTYEISINTFLENVPTYIQGNFVIKSTSPIENSSNEPKNHLWTLVAPRATFEASFQICEYQQIVLNEVISGFAYHDHNCGIEPLYRDFSQWYWGNLQSEKYSIVFYDVLPFKNRSSNATVTLSTDDSFEQLIVSEVHYSHFTISAMGIRYATRYTFYCTSNNGNSIKIIIQKKRIKEQGPFYLRFAITAELYIEDRYTSNFYGIAEYMDAQKLQQQWIRPFLKVPLLRLTP